MYKSNNMVCEPVKKSASAMHVYLLNNRYLPPWKYHYLLVNRPKPPEIASRDSKGEPRDRYPFVPKKKAIRPRGPQWATRLHVPQVIWVFRGWRTENTGSFAVPLSHAVHICSACARAYTGPVERLGVTYIIIFTRSMHDTEKESEEVKICCAPIRCSY